MQRIGDYDMNIMENRKTISGKEFGLMVGSIAFLLLLMLNPFYFNRMPELGDLLVLSFVIPCLFWGKAYQHFSRKDIGERAKVLTLIGYGIALVLLGCLHLFIVGSIVASI